MLHRGPIDSVPFVGVRVVLAEEDVTQVPLATSTPRFMAPERELHFNVAAHFGRVEASVPCRPAGVSELGGRGVQW